MLALLVTDLDETLLGDNPAAQRSLAMVERLEGRLGLAAAAGRSLGSALACLRSENIPASRLVALATSVGAEVYQRGERTPDLEYASQFQSGWSREAVRAALDGLEALELQPEEN